MKRGKWQRLIERLRSIGMVGAFLVGPQLSAQESGFDLSPGQKYQTDGQTFETLKMNNDEVETFNGNLEPKSSKPGGGNQVKEETLESKVLKAEADIKQFQSDIDTNNKKLSQADSDAKEAKRLYDQAVANNDGKGAEAAQAKRNDAIKAIKDAKDTLKVLLDSGRKVSNRAEALKGQAELESNSALYRRMSGAKTPMSKTLDKEDEHQRNISVPAALLNFTPKAVATTSTQPTVSIATPDPSQTPTGATPGNQSTTATTTNETAVVVKGDVTTKTLPDGTTGVVTQNPVTVVTSQTNSDGTTTGTTKDVTPQQGQTVVATENTVFTTTANVDSKPGSTPESGAGETTSPAVTQEDVDKLAKEVIAANNAYESKMNEVYAYQDAADSAKLEYDSAIAAGDKAKADAARVKANAAIAAANELDSKMNSYASLHKKPEKDLAAALDSCFCDLPGSLKMEISEAQQNAASEAERYVDQRRFMALLEEWNPSTNVVQTSPDSKESKDKEILDAKKKYDDLSREISNKTNAVNEKQLAADYAKALYDNAVKDNDAEAAQSAQTAMNSARNDLIKLKEEAEGLEKRASALETEIVALRKSIPSEFSAKPENIDILTSAATSIGDELGSKVNKLKNTQIPDELPNFTPRTVANTSPLGGGLPPVIPTGGCGLPPNPACGRTPTQEMGGSVTKDPTLSVPGKTTLVIKIQR